MKVIFKCWEKFEKILGLASHCTANRSFYANRVDFSKFGTKRKGKLEGTGIGGNEFQVER